MRRVVVTGLGIISCIGNNAKEVSASLRAGKCGIRKDMQMEKYGFRSCVSGRPDPDPKEHIHKRSMRFMTDASGWACIAMQEAIDQAGFTEDMISNPRTGIIAGSGGPSTKVVVESADITRAKGSPKRVGPFAVPKTMSSMVSATLATHFKIRGLNYSITSACTTSLHCIGSAVEQIQWGKQDIMFAGGGEELEWTMSSLFDAMGAMSTKYNNAPETASRAFDVNRDGFVIAGGAGMITLEEYGHAKKRGANILAEVTGYGATSDGEDMVAPNGIGAREAMQLALKEAGHDVDYINPHATSTPVGDIKECRAIAGIFGNDSPMISATKSMTGHSLGAAGVHEAIYSLLMLDGGFIAPSINVFDLDPELPKLNIVTEPREHQIQAFMSNSFGFGGTNGCVIMRRV